MIQKIPEGVFLLDGHKIVLKRDADPHLDPISCRTGTMAGQILAAHNTSYQQGRLSLKFDALAAHDMTYIGVLQTAIACGIDAFPVPFVMTDCHNSLCAMAGTYNEDDHLFGLSAAKKYGGIHVPAHQAVIHQYMREMMAGGGKMILGADSHTRYGALGTLAIGEGAGELVKQLVGRTYDIDYPEVVLVYLSGEPIPGVGPQDVALSLIKAVFQDGFVKNRVLEFCGPGIGSLPVDYRNGIDVMTTESACLSSIWETDSQVQDFLAAHGRKQDHRSLHPNTAAYYDRALLIDLSEIVPVIAMPFHPSNVYEIAEFNQNASDILAEVEHRCNEQMEEFGLKLDLRGKLVQGRLRVDQGVIAGCAGGLFTNLCAAADILRGRSIGNNAFGLHIYPASQPILAEIIKNGAVADIIYSGADFRSAFCGPCFGAGDVPGQMGLSVRHTTRNFANRDGSRPRQGQIAAVALMDARSIAATAVSGGFLTPATELAEVEYRNHVYCFDGRMYQNRCLNRIQTKNREESLVMGPNIRPIPPLPAFRDHLLLKVASYLPDPVTTTDELIPGGESASYRSNLMRLADYALSARDPQYVPLAKAIRAAADAFDRPNQNETFPEFAQALSIIEISKLVDKVERAKITVASVLVAQKPGDGSAREYAATCQRMLGGAANICKEYATKRYRSNLINWGIFPFTAEDVSSFTTGAFLFIPNLRQIIQTGGDRADAYLLGDTVKSFSLSISPLFQEEREILLAGCLINYYKQQN